MKLYGTFAILMALVIVAACGNKNTCHAGSATSATADVKSSDAEDEDTSNSEEIAEGGDSDSDTTPLDAVDDEPETTTASDEDGTEPESASSSATGNTSTGEDEAESDSATSTNADDEGSEAESASSDAEDNSPSDEEVTETSVPPNADGYISSPSDNLFAGNMASIATTQKEISERQAAANAELEKANALLSKIATNGQSLVDAKAIDHELARKAIELQERQLEATVGNSTPTNIATTTPDSVSLDEAEAAAILRIQQAGSTAVTLVESASDDAVDAIASAKVTVVAQVKKAGKEEITKITSERKNLLGDIAALLDKRGLTERPDATATAKAKTSESKKPTTPSSATVEPNRSVAGLSHTWSRHNADGTKGSCAPLAAGQVFAPCPHCGSTGACNGHNYHRATTVVSGAIVRNPIVGHTSCNKADGSCNAQRVIASN